MIYNKVLVRIVMSKSSIMQQSPHYSKLKDLSSMPFWWLIKQSFKERFLRNGIVHKESTNQVSIAIIISKFTLASHPGNSPWLWIVSNDHYNNPQNSNYNGSLYSDCQWLIVNEAIIRNCLSVPRWWCCTMVYHGCIPSHSFAEIACKAVGVLHHFASQLFCCICCIMLFNSCCAVLHFVMVVALQTLYTTILVAHYVL